jgi:predicted RNA binding protein YcfA (HicA-like mRNA interferase family)
MKRIDLDKHLKKNGCKLLREGANHSVWVNTLNDNQSTVPRHKDIDNRLCKNICKQPSVPVPSKF